MTLWRTNPGLRIVHAHVVFRVETSVREEQPRLMRERARSDKSESRRC